MQDSITLKDHDELRQGEAFLPKGLSLSTPSKSFYIESYGCAMNFADSEVVASILSKEGFGAVKDPELADLILINTCSIREKAEATVRKRLTEFRKLKKNKSWPHRGRAGLHGGKTERNFYRAGKIGRPGHWPGCLSFSSRTY